MLFMTNKEGLSYNEKCGYDLDYEFNVLHCHEFWEFFFTVDDISHRFAKYSEAVPTHHICIIRPNDTHAIASINYESMQSIKLLNLKISASELKAMLDPFNPGIYDKLLSLEKVPTLPSTQEVINLFNEYISRLKSSKNIDYNCLLIKTLIFQIIKSYYPILYNEYQPTTKSPDVIQDLISRMNSTAYLSSNISTLLEGYHYSHVQIHRLFKEQTGTSIKKYFMEIKLHHAALLLKNTQKSILEISNDLGIASMSHFDKIFLARYKTTPSEYRKQNSK